jgi:hypothetical protein
LGGAVHAPYLPQVAQKSKQTKINALHVIDLCLTAIMHTTYDYTVPVFIKGLSGLKIILQKAQAHGLDETTLLNDRLAPDMFPLVKQVQVACDGAKGASARLAGVEVPVFEDTEVTFAELFERIDKTIAFVQTISSDAFTDADTRQITLPYFPDKFLSGFDYAREYALPNFFFHIAMTYALIRKNGVAIGKADYINGLPLQDL